MLSKEVIKMITFLSSRIADFLYKHNIIKKEDIEICRYGYEVLFFNIMNMAIIIILGSALDKLLYSLIFFIIFASIRQCCGGYHSKSTIICTFVYVGIYIAIMFLATTEYTEKYFTLPIDIILCLSYISSAAAHAPIDNKNKCISDEKRGNLKKSVLYHVVY